jgi:hypothetical protein
MDLEIRSLPPWPLIKPLPQDAQFVMYVPAEDQEFRLLPEQVGSGELTASQRARLSTITLAAADGEFLGYATLSDLLAANRYTDGAITLNEPAGAEGLELSGDIAALRGEGNALYANTGRVALAVGRVSEVELINVDIASRALFNCRLNSNNRIEAGATVTATDCQIRGDRTTVAGTLVLAPGTTVDGEFIIEPGGEVLDQRGGGSSLDTAVLGDVPTAKALAVIAAYKVAGGPVEEADPQYFGQEFIDDSTEPGDEFLYVCRPRRPATTGQATVWKWGRYLEAGV